MATSSVNHVFVVKDPKKVEALAESMERASRGSKYKGSTQYIRISKKSDIDKFFDCRNKNRK